MPEPVVLVVLVACGLLAFMGLIAGLQFNLIGRPAMRATMHGAPVSVAHIVAMRMRGNPPDLLIDAYITLKRAGAAVTIADVENTYIDGRNGILTSDDLVALVQKKLQADRATSHS